MKFTAALFALMAITSVVAAPAPLKQAEGKGLAALQGLKASKGAKASKGSASSDNNVSLNNATTTATSVDSSSTSVSSSDNSTDSSVSSSDNSTDSSASSTSSAAPPTRSRACDQGDQSLAAGLQASVVIGIGQQAAVVTLQNSTNADDFSTNLDRLNQFISTQSLQLQMAQGIADDDSFAQTQLGLLAKSQTEQESLAKGLVDAQTSADDLTQLLQSFQTSTGVAQDGVDQALIDCFLPLTAISG